MRRKYFKDRIIRDRDRAIRNDSKTVFNVVGFFTLVLIAYIIQFVSPVEGSPIVPTRYTYGF